MKGFIFLSKFFFSFHYRSFLVIFKVKSRLFSKNFSINLFFCFLTSVPKPCHKFPLLISNFILYIYQLYRIVFIFNSAIGKISYEFKSLEFYFNFNYLSIIFGKHKFCFYCHCWKIENFISWFFWSLYYFPFDFD
jgi:hypothetical protein